MNRICIIPARSGSTRIKNKNFKLFLGIPILQRVAEKVLQSNLFDRVIVTTDSMDYISKVTKIGCEAPFVREKKLSDDYTGTHEVIVDAIRRLDLSDCTIVSCIYPTAVFLNINDLEVSLNLAEKHSKGQYFVPVCSFDYPIQRALVEMNGIFSAREPSFQKQRSQDLEETFHDCGQFYTANVKHWKDQTNLLDNCQGIILPKWRVQDIDTLDDWLDAEIRFEALQKKGEYF